MSSSFSYHEIAFHLPVNSTQRKNQVVAFFASQGIRASLLSESSFKTKVKISYFTQDSRIYRKLLKASAQQGMKAQSSWLTKKDWFDKWQRYFKKRRIGKSFLIVPVRQGRQGTESQSRKALYLDPAGAFGTGSHETTRLVLELLEDLEFPGKQFLDVGTGTGILAIAVYRLNPQMAIHALDLDPVSVQSAKSNFHRNAMSRFKISCTSFESWNVRKRFDLVTANLTGTQLLKCKKTLIRRLNPGGLLIVSGILRLQFKTFLEDFSDPHFALIKHVSGRQWSAAIYQKK